MGTNARNTVGLKLIQLSSDTYAIQHKCLWSLLNTVRIGEEMLIVYPNTVDPVIFEARLLELWQEGDVLFLKLWNFNHQREDLYTQDLTTENCLFSFVSIPFISRLAKIITGKCNPESCMEINQNVREQSQTKTFIDPLKNNSNHPKPFYNSSGKKVLELISSSEIMLDLPFILTQNKRLRLNLPYLKTENNLSGNDITAVRLLNFDTYDTIIVLYVQDLQSKKTFSLEYNMDSTSGYWIWSLSDFESLVDTSKTGS